MPYECSFISIIYRWPYTGTLPEGHASSRSCWLAKRCYRSTFAIYELAKKLTASICAGSEAGTGLQGACTIQSTVFIEQPGGVRARSLWDFSVHYQEKMFFLIMNAEMQANEQ